MSKPTGNPGVDKSDVDPSLTDSDETKGADGAGEPSTGSDPDQNESSFGTGVPYSAGEGHTEEVDPILLDSPLTENGHEDEPGDRSEDSDKPQPLPELKAPERKLVLSDLFDSAPPPSGRISLTPPNPTDFWSSRPPPVSGKPSPPRPPPSRTKSPEPAQPVATPARSPIPSPTGKVPSEHERADTLALEIEAELESVESVEETIPLDLHRNLPNDETEAAPRLTSRDATTQGVTPIEPTTEQSDSGEDSQPSRPVEVEVEVEDPPIPASLTPDPQPAAVAVAPPTTPQPSVVEAMPAPAAVTPGAALPSVVVAGESAAPPPSADELKKKSARAAKATMIISLPSGEGLPGGGDLQAAIQAARNPSSPPPAPTPAAASAMAAPPPAPHTRSGMWLAAGVMFALAAVLVGYRLLVPSTGTLVVTAQGPGGAPIKEVAITIQGLTCGTSPCIISRLQPGSHRVEVTGQGLKPSTSFVELEAGKELAHNVLLAGLDNPSNRNSPGASSGPAQPVNFGTVTIELSASSKGAAVTLDDAFLLDFPSEMELEADRPHRLSASKPGYRDFRTVIEVEAGQTNQVIEIDLRRGTARKKSSSKKRKKSRKKKKKKKSKRKKPAGDSSQGFLTLRSTPSSNVILNGRPIGKTPKTRVRVPGDSLQTVVFVHPEKGRRRAQKYVKAGEKQTVSIQF